MAAPTFSMNLNMHGARDGSLTVRMEAGRKGGKMLKTCYLPLRP
jgi:hypothetical protein